MLLLDKANVPIVSAFIEHRDWDTNQGWKNWLNNLRLILLPWVSFNFLKPWLEVFPIPELISGFEQLTTLMNQVPGPVLPRAAPTPPVFFSA